ncbi:MAG: DUF1538 domain-containing protein [Erysipelotrichaceae bacterium]|nr:DUF1538 domain-containing protein [Erysipelotrichaceae bacterium]
MRKALWAKLKEALVSVAPVALIVLVLSFTPLAKLTMGERIVFAICSALLVAGIGLFNLGADLAMSPIGRHVGEGLTKSGKIKLLAFTCFLMGVLITVAEPDLSVLAGQISDVINPMLLIVTVGVGVGLFLVMAVLRIITRTDLTAMLLFFYMLLFAFSALLLARNGQAFLPLSFDSGGVTTGPITVPFIMALGIGIAQTIGGRNAGENSFGLIALCSAGPVLAVLILSVAAGSGSISFPLPDYSMNITAGEFFLLLGETAWDVAKSLLLMSAFFAVLQTFILHLPRQRIAQILFGLGFAFAGLVIFLMSVTIGYMPVGYRIGVLLAGYNPKLLVIFAFILGMVVVLAEPAVHVLNQQVEEVTNGAVTKRQMMIALSVGVGVSIGLSILRLILGFSLLYYLIPGYLISLGLSFFVPKLYTAIAFDSGGVASGPLTSSFILPMAIGACVSLRGAGAVMDFAFGVVSMVAMTPLITIQSLGFRSVVSNIMRENAAVRRILDSDDAQIIYFD